MTNGYVTSGVVCYWTAPRPPVGPMCKLELLKH